MENQPHILVVDDDERLRALLEQYLGEHGFLVTPAPNAAAARQTLACLAADLIVLDVMMPGETGLELASSLRQQGDATPILLLTAMGEAEDRIKGLQSGGDDYLVKPFEPMELVLRIGNILRRTAARASGSKVRFGAFEFDLAHRTLTQNGRPLYLTSGEAQLLAVFAARAGQTINREELTQLLAANGEAPNERSIDVQVTRLRRKIELNPGTPVYLRTVRGAGYTLSTGE